MPQSQIYSISQAQLADIQQPQPNGIPHKSSNMFLGRQHYNEKWECTLPMFLGVVALCASLFFIAYVYVMPNELIPKYKDPYRHLIPLVKQGNLAVYPLNLQWDNDPTRNQSYFITLPSENVSQTSDDIQKILDTYLPTREENCTECWVANPSFSKPCCFHLSWLGDGCSKVNNFGYSEQDEIFNPCIFLRFEKTGDWRPEPNKKIDMPPSTVQHYDPSFIQIYCHTKMSGDSSRIKNITVTPEKGFSSVFFPVAKFSPKLYIPPIVAVQFIGIERGKNFIVECAVLAENALTLHDEGMFHINFIST